MNARSFFLISLVVIVSSFCSAQSLALQFTAPTEDAIVAAGPVLFSWDEPNVVFSLSGTSPIQISGLGTTLTLSPGAYIATITNSSNSTISLGFNVEALQQNTTATNSSGGNVSNSSNSNPQSNTSNPINTTNTTILPNNQQITLTTDSALYEIGSSARIRVVVATPEALALKVQRVSGTFDSYTVNVQQQTDFLYPLSASGSYIVTATGASTSASTSFTAHNTSLGARITGDTSGTAGRVTSFGTTVTGGTAPFTYRWQFSDNTTSTGPSVDHVFDFPGNYTVTLVVTDVSGRTASATRLVEIEEFLSRLTVTSLGLGGRVLSGTLITISDSRTARSAVTDSFGSVRFTNLPLGNYSINGSYNYSATGSIREYKNTTSLALTRDRSVTVNLAVPDTRITAPVPVTPVTPINPVTPVGAIPGTSNLSNVSNNSNSTVPVPGVPVPALPSAAQTLAEQSAEIDAQALAQANAEAKAAAQIESSIVDVEQEKLAQARSEALGTLRAAQANLLRSEVRAELVRTLGIDQRFSALETEVSAATTVEQVAQILARSPRDVTIIARDTTVMRRTAADIKGDVQAYLEAIKADDDTAASVKYTVREAITSMSITAKRSVVKITRVDGAAPETFTVFSRSSEAIPEVAYIEVIPKSIANDASAIVIRGSHEVVKEDPIIKFKESQYSYYVKGEVTGEPSVFILPTKLLEPTGLAGLVSVRFNLQSFENGGLYLGILALVVFGVLGGNLYVRRPDSDPAYTFEELAELTLSLIERGDYAAASKYLPELVALHKSLNPIQQARSQETVSVLREAVMVNNFTRAEAALRASFTLSDHVATATAYERLLSAHSALSDSAREVRKPLMDAAQKALEEHLQHHEAEATIKAEGAAIT